LFFHFCKNWARIQDWDRLGSAQRSYQESWPWRSQNQQCGPWHFEEVPQLVQNEGRVSQTPQEEARTPSSELSQLLVEAGTNLQSSEGRHIAGRCVESLQNLSATQLSFFPS
jgi:hypothetical protein